MGQSTSDWRLEQWKRLETIQESRAEILPGYLRLETQPVIFAESFSLPNPRTGFSALAIEAQLPVYNPLTRCHVLSVPDDPLSFALCLQRGTDKQHPYNLHTAPLFCSLTYPPHGHLIELSQLSSDLIDFLLQSLTKLLNAKTARIDRPEPNFLWISASKSIESRIVVICWDRGI